MTAAIVAAGVVAKKVISPIIVNAQVSEVAGSSDINSAIEAAMKDGDSVGGIISVTTTSLPIGLGEPFFDSVESLLAHAIFSIPAIKGIEFGSGFAAAKKRGSEHNDEILTADGKTGTNNAGGINGGITNGNDLQFRIAVKPTSSIKKEKQTISLSTGQAKTLSVGGRHDACIALRVPPVAEAMTALVLADLCLMNKR